MAVASLRGVRKQKQRTNALGRLCVLHLHFPSLSFSAARFVSLSFAPCRVFFFPRAFVAPKVEQSTPSGACFGSVAAASAFPLWSCFLFSFFSPALSVRFFPFLVFFSFVPPRFLFTLQAPRARVVLGPVSSFPRARLKRLNARFRTVGRSPLFSSHSAVRCRRRRTSVAPSVR